MTTPNTQAPARAPLPPQTDDAFMTSGGPSYKPAPDGPHSAVCCDVLYMGWKKTEWQGKAREVEEVRLLFQIEERNEQGQRYVVGRTFTKSLSEKANLRKFLEQWRGRAFSEEELKGFQLLTLLGKTCMIQVKHAERNGRTYANIDTVMRLPRGTAPVAVVDYVRVKDRKPAEQAPPSNGAPHPADFEDGGWGGDDDLTDDLPF